MLIYVAGPLSDGTTISKYSNMVKAVEVAEQLHENGHMAYVPHLTIFQHRIIQRLRPGYIPQYERWLSLDFEIIRRCDALFFIAPSVGANKERTFAELIGKPICYSLDDVRALT